MAGDREEIMTVLKGGKHITSMRFVQSCAPGSGREKDMGSCMLLRRTEGKWSVVMGSGGAAGMVQGWACCVQYWRKFFALPVNNACR